MPLEQQIANVVDQSAVARDQVHGEVRVVKLTGLAVRLVVDVLLVAPKRRWIAVIGEGFQVLLGAVREVQSAANLTINQCQ